ncbi:hypothetical protein L1049_022201 [Liquidambar formosana]|uniref:Uncharacterized protein n=1 Tax=Liquidambar formosana TaxID=63359 RepID=A0AAP0WQU2_LIQFO
MTSSRISHLLSLSFSLLFSPHEHLRRRHSSISTGQFCLGPKKSELKVGESSAFFTYVKSSKLKNNSRGVALYLHLHIMKNMHDLQNHATSSMLSRYNHLPQCPSHVPGMASFPYYSVSMCLRPGQISTAHHSWPSFQSSSSADVSGFPYASARLMDEGELVHLNWFESSSEVDREDARHDPMKVVDLLQILQRIKRLTPTAHSYYIAYTPIWKNAKCPDRQNFD